jgi:hypothetical protein
MPLPEEDERVGLVYADIALINSAGEVTVPERVVQRQRILERRNEFFPLLTVNYIPRAHHHCPARSAGAAASHSFELPLPRLVSHHRHHRKLELLLCRPGSGRLRYSRHQYASPHDSRPHRRDHQLSRAGPGVRQRAAAGGKGARAAARLWTQLSHLRRSVFRLRDERECAALLLAGHPASSRVSV